MKGIRQSGRVYRLFVIATASCGMKRAAVFKDVEPWTVVGGNPAKFIKKRGINKL
jgi:acetyltransferase-like isoleucine patch superfamily enzyme